MNKAVLFFFSIVGLFVVNNLFLYWQFFEFNLNDLLYNKFALALFIESVCLMLLLAYYFKVNPIGKYKWYWFIVLALLGSLLFALPFYYWLNKRDKSH